MKGMDLALTPEGDLLDQGLSDYLSQMTQVGSGARGPAQRRDSAPFAAVLDEVWKTLLPRRLIFRSAEGGSLVLDVVDRHIFGVGALSCLSNVNPELLDSRTEATGQIEAGAARLFKLLTLFSMSEGPISVVSRRCALSPSKGAGVSVQSLRCLGLLEINPKSGLIERFMADLGDLPGAWLVDDGTGNVVEFGDTSTLFQLQMSLQRQDALNEDSDEQMIILVSYPDMAKAAVSQAVLMAQVGGTQMFCRFDGKHSYRVAQLWIDAKSKGA